MSSTARALLPPSASRPHRERVVRLLPRVLDNGRVLLKAYRAIAQAIREERAITPAAEWLVDNYHIVDEQLREIHDDLPSGYYRELPKLTEGHLQGYPRVFGLAWAFVAHTDSRFDPEMLRRFVRAYQRVQPLTIGELWAVAITLRVVLVENLRRLAERIVHDRAAREEADKVADRLLGLGGSSIQPAATVLRPFERVSLTTAFAVQLVQRLRDQDPVVTPALRWLEENLAAQGTTTDAIVRVEHQQQAAMNVTVRNVITSMRLVSAFDWAEFFESVSLVDAILWTDTGFAAPDFVTRDRYRDAIEELSRRSRTTSVKLPAGRLFKQNVFGAKPKGTATRLRSAARIPAITSSPMGVSPSSRNSAFACRSKLDFAVPIVTNATSRYLATIAIVSGPHPDFVPV